MVCMSLPRREEQSLHVNIYKKQQTGCHVLGWAGVRAVWGKKNSVTEDPAT